MTFCHRHFPVAPSFHFQKGRKAGIFEETHTGVTQKLDPSWCFFVCVFYIHCQPCAATHMMQVCAMLFFWINKPYFSSLKPDYVPFWHEQMSLIMFVTEKICSRRLAFFSPRSNFTGKKNHLQFFRHNFRHNSFKIQNLNNLGIVLKPVRRLGNHQAGTGAPRAWRRKEWKSVKPKTDASITQVKHILHIYNGTWVQWESQRTAQGSNNFI